MVELEVEEKLIELENKLYNGNISESELKYLEWLKAKYL